MINNALDEYNKLKLRLALTPEEKKRIEHKKLFNPDIVSYEDEKSLLQAHIKSLNRKMSMINDKIITLKMQHEELKQERNEHLSKLQTIKARISRGEM